MKFLVVLLAILMVPLFMFLEKNHFQENLQSDLNAEVDQRIEQLKSTYPAQTAIETSSELLDYTLEGETSTLELRSEVEDSVDAIRGARVIDNNITVPAQLSFSRVNGELSTTGLLPSYLQNDKNFRSGLNSIGINDIDSQKITFNENVSAPDWMFSKNFRDWETVFFSTKGKRGLDVSSNPTDQTAEFELNGDATGDLSRKWTRSLKQVVPNASVKTNFDVYPSTYHFPTYTRKSQISTAEYDTLNKKLSDGQIYFDLGSSTLNEEMTERSRLLSEVIKSSEDNVTFIIGGHADATGSVETNKIVSLERVKAVVAVLLENGVDQNRIKSVAFGESKASGDGADQNSRRVEALVE